MSSFDIVFPFLLSNEDFTPPRYEVVADNVGQVLSGINSKYWPVDFARISALSMEDRPAAVKRFYYSNFWNQWMQSLNSNSKAALILDASVNMGAGIAVKLAQTAAGLAESAIDGHWGPITFAAVNDAPEGDFVAKFIDARKARYQAIGGESLLNAWLARAEKVPQFT